MSEREQKLEAALRELRSYISSCSYGETMHSIIDTALAMPPTSEWNEAIEAALLACRDCRSPLDSLHYGREIEAIEGCIDAIRALKRKEQP